MSMNRGLETGNDHREDRFGVLCSKTNHHPKYEFSMRIFVYRILVYILLFKIMCNFHHCIFILPYWSVLSVRIVIFIHPSKSFERRQSHIREN